MIGLGLRGGNSGSGQELCNICSDDTRPFPIQKSPEYRNDDGAIIRPYSQIPEAERIRCKQHVPEDAWDGYVPLIEDDDGSVWGYIAVPPDAVEKWRALPEE